MYACVFRCTHTHGSRYSVITLCNSPTRGHRSSFIRPYIACTQSDLTARLVHVETRKPRALHTVVTLCRYCVSNRAKAQPMFGSIRSSYTLRGTTSRTHYEVDASPVSIGAAHLYWHRPPRSRSWWSRAPLKVVHLCLPLSLVCHERILVGSPPALRDVRPLGMPLHLFASLQRQGELMSAPFGRDRRCLARR